ncbi:MAG: antitoxin VapB family protein [Nitrososphaeraceae archaeon]
MKHKYKTINLPLEVYEKLRQRGYVGDSFSKVISELLKENEENESIVQSRVVKP